MLREILHGYVRIICVDTLRAESLLLYRGAFDDVDEEFWEMNIVMCNPTRNNMIDIYVSAFDIAVSNYLQEYDYGFQIL